MKFIQQSTIAGRFLRAALIAGLAITSILHAGDMATVGVGAIKSSIPGSDPSSFQSMIETQLIKTGKLRVIERAQLEQILREKGLSMAGITDGAGSISGIKGVGYLVYGTITKLGRTGQNVNFGGFGVRSSRVEMAVDLKVVDAASGEILYAETVEEAVGGGQHIAVQGFSTGGRESDPLSDVERLTAKSVTARIITSIYPIKVIAIQKDGRAIINYGDSVLTPHDQLKVFELGESFIDPDTGKKLGADEKEVAILQVDEVNERFSKASIISGKATVGNVARRISSVDAQKNSQASTGGRLP